MFYLFLFVCVLHLGCCYFQVKKLQRITKVFLMPLLLCYGLMTVPNVSLFLILALIFGFLGDTFLLFEKHPLYFMCGLSTFLLGHVFYIFELLKHVNPLHHLSITSIIASFLLLIGIFMFKTIATYLGNLKIPVIAYCLTILSMLGVAVLYCLTQFSANSQVALIGAISFVISDYLLARSIFIGSFKHKDFYIMLTYLLAQTLLVLALI